MRCSLAAAALAAAAPLAPAADYHVYVAAESSDEVYELRFDGRVAEVVHVIPVGYQPTEIEGPHGMTVAPDGAHWFVTVAHGKPFGILYKYATGTNELVGQTELGLFPATMQISEDTGLLYCVNFDLHGDMSPSTVSIVDPDEMVEVERTETGPMPHGSRLSADGSLHYSCAMMSDELFEIDAATFEVVRSLRLTDGTGGVARRRDDGHHDAVTKPTWVQPHPSEPRVYVALNGAAQAVEVDTEKWRVRRRFPTARGPYNLDLTPEGERMVVTYKSSQAVGIWDLESGEEVERVPTTRRVPHGVVISPDGRYAFVSNEGVGSEAGTVDVIDLDAAERVTSTEIGLQAGGITFWKMEERGP